MCNQAAIRVHCRLGDEVIADRTAHIINAETGGTAANSGVMIRMLDGPNGVFTADQVKAALRDPNSRNAPRSRLVSVENTSNGGFGTVWPLATMQGVSKVAHDAGLAVHMDGARLCNAAVKAGIKASDYAACVDSLWLDYTKGLGAPVGASLAGSKEFIKEAWRQKQMLGGSMRQSGVIAAAALYALEHNWDRLAEDHDNAHHLAAGIANIKGLDVRGRPHADQPRVLRREEAGHDGRPVRRGLQRARRRHGHQRRQRHAHPRRHPSRRQPRRHRRRAEGDQRRDGGC